MAIAWKQRGVYSFDVYPTIIGTLFRNVTVLGVMTYEVATVYGDLVSYHRQYFPYLPANTPDDPELFEYVLVRLESGENVILATPWIKENTVRQTNSFALQVIIEKVTPSDVPLIRDSLAINGFVNFKIKNLSTGAILN